MRLIQQVMNSHVVSGNFQKPRAGMVVVEDDGGAQIVSIRYLTTDRDPQCCYSQRVNN